MGEPKPSRNRLPVRAMTEAFEQLDREGVKMRQAASKANMTYDALRTWKSRPPSIMRRFEQFLLANGYDLRVVKAGTAVVWDGRD